MSWSRSVLAVLLLGPAIALVLLIAGLVSLAIVPRGLGEWWRFRRELARTRRSNEEAARSGRDFGTTDLFAAGSGSLADPITSEAAIPTRAAACTGPPRQEGVS